MYLPASETVKASFGGVEFTGKVEAGKDENVLERELTSVDYGKEFLKTIYRAQWNLHSQKMRHPDGNSGQMVRHR